MSTSTSSSVGLAAVIPTSTPDKSGTAMAQKNEQSQRFASPSFLSPEPASNAQKPQNKLTLSGQPTRKLKPMKRPLGAHQGLSTPSTHRKPLVHKAKKLKLTPNVTSKPKKVTQTPSKSTHVLEDISNRNNAEQQQSSSVHKTTDVSTTRTHDPTRKLEFPTPVKAPSDKKSRDSEPKPVETSSSSSSSDESGYSSDEAEVTFDAATIGNMRVVREALSQSPALSTASSSSNMAPVGLEFQFSVSSTVSSVAVAPNGKFLVVGFYNGMVYLYPLTKDSLVFRRGVLLDQIMPRGMYTQIMVTVSIPEDGKFIFAGVYRGSTDIRAFEVDSITLPSISELQQANGAPSPSLFTTGDSDDDSMDEDDGASAFGLPTAKVVSHTYSDAKLKGFAAAKSFYHKESNRTEYRLLCGIGIKNVHMWRFYQQKTEKGLEWNWECVFDKQTNGISLEFISFHPTIANLFISKSEHQNVRIWHLEEEYDASDDSVTIKKKSHTDVKQTTDTVAVYGDYAYGGSESLAVIDLQSASRMDLDLPLSAKEQRAQREAALKSRNATSLRAWNPRGSRRRGAEDTSAQRHMRTVSKIAGQDASPFTVGMCSDGSVFFHEPKEETGIATPLDYIEGYEQFFVDPSLDFQAQFSDLTRVNTSGLLAVLPLPDTEKEKWMVVAANQDQILVRSLDAFLHRNQQKKEYSQVKSDLRNVMRDLGGAKSSSDGNDSSSDSDVVEKHVIKDKRHKKLDKVSHKRSRQEMSSKSSQESGRSVKTKRSRLESDKASSAKESAKLTEKKMPVKTPKKPIRVKQLSVDDQAKVIANMAAVTTPKRGRNLDKMSTSTDSPVVSISSSSGSSNPNTPEQPGLSRVERQLLALKELQWTPPPAAKSKTDNQEDLTDSAVDAAAVLAQLGSNSNQAESKSKTGGKKSSHRMKVQALFIDDDSENKENGVSKGPKTNDDTVSSSSKKPAPATSKRGRKKSVRVEPEKQDAVVSAPESKQAEPVKPVEEEEEDDAELDEELEQLEQYEPEFDSVPLVSDKGSLLAATMYQYAGSASSVADADADIEADHATATSEQTNLLLHFSRQNERLKMNFLSERERIYQHPDCSCASHPHSKKSSSSSGGVNWRRNVAHDYLKRKQLKRRHKKQLAAKLQQLRATYAVQMRDLQAIQQMEANAFRARQQFRHLQRQIRRQSHKSDSTSPASPIKYASMPDHLSSARFPYPDLLS